MIRPPLTWLGLLAALLLSGCATYDGGPSPSLDKSARWAILPFTNTTETPLAGQRAEMLAGALLGAKAIGEVRHYPLEQNETLFAAGNDGKLRDQALQWARKQGMRYALTGEVFEWRYKVGVDGEPAVGISLRVIDVANGKILWAGASSKSGWHRDSLGMVAQGVLRRLVAEATGSIAR